MATASYNEKTQTWILNCKDLTKEAKGEKNIYFKRKKKDTAYSSMSKRDKIARLAQMQNLAEEYEQKTKLGFYTRDEMKEAIDAVEYLTNGVTDDMMIKRGNEDYLFAKKRHLSLFVSWLESKHKGIHLHQINNDIAKSYFLHLAKNGYAYMTIKKIALILSFIFTRIREKFEDYDSDYNYKNPFCKDSNLPRMDFDSVEREGFTIEQLKEVIGSCEDDYLKLLIKLGFILGNRKGDLLQLRWTTESIDLKNRVITIRQQKTIKHKDKIRSKIYITDELMNMIKPYYSDGDYLFDVWKFSNKEPQSSTPNRLFRQVMVKLGLDGGEKKGIKTVHHYSFHSLRGTCITELKKANFNNDLIDYLVGHRGKGIDAAHYNKFSNSPKESTEQMIDYLISLIK